MLPEGNRVVTYFSNSRAGREAYISSEQSHICVTPSFPAETSGRSPDVSSNQRTQGTAQSSAKFVMNFQDGRCSGAARRLLRDRIAVFDESDVSESSLELDPNQWHYTKDKHRQTSKRIKRKRSRRFTNGHLGVVRWHSEGAQTERALP
jgi:hypothetical protein